MAKKRKYQKTTRKWIQEAKLNEGALTRYIMRNYGKKRGFTPEGTIRVSVLRALAKNPNVQEKTRKRARLALTLRGLKKK